MSVEIMEQEPLAVANYVVKYALKQHSPITNLHLQKILFFVQGYFLTKYQQPLMNCTFTKWKYGPVLHEIYQTFKSADTSPIKQLGINVYGDHNGMYTKCPMMDFDIVHNDTEINNLLNSLINMTPSQLITLTQEHSSWKDNKRLLLTGHVSQYTNEEIRSCYLHSDLKQKPKTCL